MIEWLSLKNRNGDNMSFSSSVKEELNNNVNFKNKELLKAELLGYFISDNSEIKGGKIVFVTENEFNIEHFYKLLSNLGIDYDPEIKKKTFVATVNEIDFDKYVQLIDTTNSETKRAIIRGCFMGGGSINDPTKSYHAEIKLITEKYCNKVAQISKELDLMVKKSSSPNTLYIKDGDGIAALLAIIGANNSVIKFEEIRTIREVRNDLNRKVNCEAANINKTVKASVDQIEDIEFIKKMKKYGELTDEQKEIAKLRIEFPDATLKELGLKLDNPIGKSGVNHRLQKIHEFAEELRKLSK